MTSRVDSPAPARVATAGDAFRAAALSWRWRRALGRGQFWILFAAIVATQLVVPTVTRVAALRVVGGAVELVLAVVLCKVTAWRYVDIGRSPWWSPIQLLLVVVGAVLVAFGSFATLIDVLNDVRTPTGLDSQWAALVVSGLALIAITWIWATVWCLLPTRARDREGPPDDGADAP